MGGGEVRINQAGPWGCSEDFGSPGKAVNSRGCDPTQVFTGSFWSLLWRVKVGT